jgi:phage protein U
MAFRGSRQLVRWSSVVFFSLSMGAAVSAAPADAVPRLRIKNAHTINVRLGSRRESAAGLRPDKGTWKAVLTPDLAGGSAQLQDITPDVAHSRWTLAMAGEELVLDPKMFLAEHVYEMELRKDGRLLGKALIYLYPPARAGGTSQLPRRRRCAERGRALSRAEGRAVTQPPRNASASARNAAARWEMRFFWAASISAIDRPSASMKKSGS